jgi:hypothetical protein
MVLRELMALGLRGQAGADRTPLWDAAARAGIEAEKESHMFESSRSEGEFMRFPSGCLLSREPPPGGSV